MPSLHAFRNRYAEAFDLAPATWKILQTMLTPVLGMRARPTDDRVQIDVSPEFSISPPATPEDGGLLVIAGMLQGSRPTIVERVLLRWHTAARDGACPVTGARYFHEALSTLLLLPEYAAALDHIEMTREFTAVMLAWRDGRQTVFETTDVHDRAKRELTMQNGHLFTVAMLSGTVIHDMAVWLGAEPEVLSRRAALIMH